MFGLFALLFPFSDIYSLPSGLSNSMSRKNSAEVSTEVSKKKKKKPPLEVGRSWEGPWTLLRLLRSVVLHQECEVPDFEFQFDATTKFPPCYIVDKYTKRLGKRTPRKTEVPKPHHAPHRLCIIGNHSSVQAGLVHGKRQMGVFVGICWGSIKPFQCKLARGLAPSHGVGTPRGV